ncbi:hypothetical protein EJ04DRAFT_423710 [Polyplosphaeria fusca]|uniref:Uncharacterized protein n=1 Tax=Polyplosphaeria fusca TaxID=682080 RepID=A0A9P4V901_9PLEO|nr:hypothetical protein EJ04DRAFT_423710 [Polyplosphaeria fusca]
MPSTAHLALEPKEKTTVETCIQSTQDAGPDSRGISSGFALPPLPTNVELVPLTEDLIPSFKRLNSLTLPVPYAASFYRETMTEPHHSVTLMAVWHSTPPTDPPSSGAEKPRLVGAIRCRILPGSTLYLSTLCLLAPYRSHGIATHLLQRVVIKASKEHSVTNMAAHVWEANDDGLEWYKKRGFEAVGKEDQYYSKLKPSGAILMRRAIGVGDFLREGDCPPTSAIPNPKQRSMLPKTPSSKSVNETKPSQSRVSGQSVQITHRPHSACLPNQHPRSSSQRPQDPTRTQTEEVGPSSTRCPVPLYYKCGGYDDGKPWTGCTKCVAGAKCVWQNDYYYQCVAEDSVGSRKY